LPGKIQVDIVQGDADSPAANGQPDRQPVPAEKLGPPPPGAEERPVAGAAPPRAVAPFNEKAAKLHQTRWAKYLRVPVVQTNSIGMKFALIPPGQFDMGSSQELIEQELRARAGDRWITDRVPFEAPRHRVRITKPFCLGVTLVTQEEFQHVMGRNPSLFKGDPRMPVDMVSWENAAEFCRRLSELPGENRAKRRYALPTEAQWEYACRAGNPGPWCFSNPAASLLTPEEERLVAEYAWCRGSTGGGKHPVGQKRANAWGLYDMYGSAWEWCQDWLDMRYYSRSPTDNPAGPSAPVQAAGPAHVTRGGGYHSGAAECRSAFRSYAMGGGDDVGFRVLLIMPDK
jgi:formylglycine-generating enzyme required for sulfatase activity